jgi:D-alanine--poly(phosphoribitol) ligase subunit 1
MSEATSNLGTLFSMIASKYKKNDAIVYGDGTKLTYLDLDDLSERVASILRAKGFIKGDTILIAGDKSPLMFASIVATLKIGVAYSLFDADIPTYRLAKIIQVCKPRMIVGSNLSHCDTANECNTKSILLSALNDALNTIEPNESLPQSGAPCGNDLAYIVFTSGSTGTPKGAAMTHSNVLSLIDWSSKEFSFGPGEILTNLNPCYFDNFVFDFYSSIFTGGTIAPFTKDELRDPHRLVKSIYELGCTSWFSVPSLLIYFDSIKAFEKADFSRMRRIIFGGEGYPKPKLLNLYRRYSGAIDFINVYGPSECTCIASSYKVTDRDFDDINGFMPIGSLISGFDFLIVDEELRALSQDTKGELCLIGPFVGSGYYNQPDLTARAFVSLGTIGGGNINCRAYRTGDIVKLNSADRKLYIYGRKDNQIKHMGYRIELEDIENALMQLPYITQACCVHSYQKGLSRITAFVAVNVECLVLQIKDDLAKLLPHYMMPTHFSLLADLPKNKNGKVDRARLTQSQE